MVEEGASWRLADAPAPEDERKPDTPREVTKRSWRYVLRKSFREFVDDECADRAASLTYYGVLALFPGLLALTSLLALVGQGQRAIDALFDIVRAGRSRRGARRDPRAARELQRIAGGRPGLRHRSRGRDLVGVGLRRSVQPGDEPDLRDRRGAALLEAAPDAAARHDRHARARRRHRRDPRDLGSGHRGARGRARRGRGGRDRLGDREVARCWRSR